MLQDLGGVTSFLGLAQGAELGQTNPVTPTTTIEFPLFVGGHGRRGHAEERQGRDEESDRPSEPHQT
jgi:hypothetical protein